MKPGMCVCVRMCVGVGVCVWLQKGRMQVHALSLARAATSARSRQLCIVPLGTLLPTLRPCLCLGIDAAPRQSSIPTMEHAVTAFGSRQVFASQQRHCLQSC